MELMKLSWKSNGISEESIENITKSDSNFAPTFVDHTLLPDMNFSGHCLIEDSIFIPKKVIHLYISYTLGPHLGNLKTDFTLYNCWFGSVKLTMNNDLDKYKYTGYGIGFDSRSEFLFTDGSYGKIVIIFGADMSPSVYVDNKRKDILIIGEGPTQGLNATIVKRIIKNKIVLSPHYNESKSLLLVNAKRVYQFKAKNPEIKECSLCLASVWKDFTINNMKKKRLKEVLKFFSVDFHPIDTNHILDIHTYLMKRTCDCIWTPTLNHLAKLAKWFSCVVSTYMYGAFNCMFLSCHVRVSDWIHTL